MAGLPENAERIPDFSADLCMGRAHLTTTAPLPSTHGH
jgi:hypothetical protein